LAGPYPDIIAEIPRLWRYACALTRDLIAADDLVQECLTRALSKLHLWQRETDLRAWLFTILHNQYINHVRRTAREATAVELSEREPLLAWAPQQASRLELRDLEDAIANSQYAAFGDPARWLGGNQPRRSRNRPQGPCRDYSFAALARP
jgi:RNA polymerase sigma-70 factor (ECF subfamily)